MSKDRDWQDKKEKRTPASIVVMKHYPPCKEKPTLIAIASYADPDGTNCYPSIAGISSRSGKSIRTSQYHINTLQQNNHIEVRYQQARDGHNLFIFKHALLKEIFTGISRNQMKLPIPIPQLTSEITIGTKIEGALKSDTIDMINKQMKELEESLRTGTVICPPTTTAFSSEYSELSSEEVRNLLTEQFGPGTNKV